MGGDNRIATEVKVEEKQSSQGKAYKTVSFQVACGNGSYKDANGEWKQRVSDFINVRTSVPYLAQKLEKAAKGVCIDLTGTLHVWSKKQEDGSYSNGSYIELEQNDMVHVYTPAKSDNTTAAKPVEGPEVEETIESDDFPWND